MNTKNTTKHNYRRVVTPLRRINVKKGLHFYFICLGVTVGSIFGLISFIGDVSKGNFDQPLKMLSSLLIANLFWYVLHLVTLNVKIDADEFSFSSLFGNKTNSWEGVKEVKLFTNYFGRYNLIIIWDNPTSPSGILVRSLSVSLFSNTTELSKGIVDAAYLTNPNLVLNQFTLEVLGTFPPYGIFSKRKLAISSQQAE